MASSGIKCDENVLEEYKKMSTGKNKPYRYIIFMIEQDDKGEYKKVVVEKTGERDATFQDMKDSLDSNESRYVAFDLSYHTKGENQLREKIIFIKFVPETAARKQKMVFSSTEKELKGKLGTASISASYHFDCLSEIDGKEIEEEMAKKG